jgi:hypothetical protein
VFIRAIHGKKLSAEGEKKRFRRGNLLKNL